MSANPIEFALFAPYNEEAALVGEWNDWQRIPMQKDDKGWWHVAVPLEDGEYEYKFAVKSKSYFMVDQWVEVADPRALKLTLDSLENSIITVKGGKQVFTTYEWKHDDVPLPGNDALVIYELHVGDFSGGPGDEQNPNKGKFQAVIDKLDYLKDMGINAIELMPCNEFPGERSWGYNPRSIFAVENNYGSPDDLCRLVDECHARGIRVIHDGVYNHSESNAPLTQIDHDYWYYHDNPDPEGLRFGPKFNYEHHDPNLNVWPARQHVRDAIKFWIDHFHIDGIRFDATALIKYYDYLDWLHENIHGYVKNKPFYLIAEHLPQDPTVAGEDGPMDAAWHEHYAHQITATILGKDRDGRQPYNLDGLEQVIDPRNDGFGGAFNVVNYIDNHDKDRILWELGQDATTFDDAAFRRVKLGAVILLTSPGVPMVWMGQEFGESAAKTMDWQRLDWSLLQNENNSDLLNYYKGLIRLRTSTPALHGNTIEFIAKMDERCILAYKRWDDAGGVVIVVANLADKFGGEFEIGNAGLEDDVWHEYIHNYDVTISGGVLKDSLAESEVKIYVKTP